LIRRPVTGLLYKPRMINDDECGAVGGMRIGRGNRSTRRLFAPVPLPPQIPHDLTWATASCCTLFINYDISDICNELRKREAAP
jgi:hypothetical protein